MKILPILEGKPATGKTKCTELFTEIDEYKNKSEKPIKIVSVNESINTNHLFEEIAIKNKKMASEDGVVKHCLKNGLICLFDELNLGPS